MKFIANLNGNILCPYQILLDMAGQLPENADKIKNLAFIPICDLNTTNDWINLESLGKPVAIRAKTICDIITAALSKKQNISELSLEIHCQDGLLTSDNLYCLIYLAECFKSLTLTFYSHQEKQPGLRTKIESLMNRDHIKCHFKCPDDATDTALLNQLLSRKHQHLKAQGFLLEESLFNERKLSESILNQCIGYAWTCLKSGGYEVACQLLGKVQKHTEHPVAVKEQLFMHTLMIRFFSHQYGLICETDFPEKFDTLSVADVKTLQFLKAYSATLSRHLDIAQGCFKHCHIHENMPLSDESSLYQLNLFALFQVLQGETDKAFELEFRIKDFIEQQQIDIVGLKYVNFINIARLYKKTKQYELSNDYYQKAYKEISGGGYTTSDHIYYNMNLGSLNEAAGNHPQALLYWMKAALHWLACKNKYELSWRPRLILCQEKISDISKPLPVDKATSFFQNKIKELFNLCGIEQTFDPTISYQFIDDHLNIAKENCFINKNIVVYSGKIEGLSAGGHNSSETESALCSSVSQWLHGSMNIPQDQNIIVIDTQLDIHFLCTETAAIAFARLANASNCFFNGKKLPLATHQALPPVTASLSTVIDSINDTEKGLFVRFKRSFLNKTLQAQEEIDLVNQLKETNLSLDTLDIQRLNAIQQLAKKRIVNFSHPV